MKLHTLRGRVIEHQRLFFRFFFVNNLLFIGIGLFFRIIIGDLELHLIEKPCGVQDLTHKEDGLGTDIGEEGDGCQGKHCCQTWCAQEILDVLTDIGTMIATGVETDVSQEGCQESCQSDGSPDHQDHERQEPLEQIDPEGTDKIGAQQQDEHGNEESRKTKATLDEIPRSVSANAATGVAELMMGIHDLTITRILYQALISCSSRKIGNKCQYEIDSHTHKQTAEHEVQLLVVEHIFEF